MGICASGPVDETDGEIIKAMQKEGRHDSGIKKLLLLGAGGSGKSTVFKQLKSIHGSGVSDQERKSYKSIVIGNVIDFMKVLVQKSQEFGPQQGLEKCRMGAGVQRCATILLDQPANFFPKELEKDIADAIVELWKDAGIKATFEERSRFQMQDSAEYFFDKRMDDIRKYEYFPSEQDVLRARVRTTGIIEQEFKLKDHTFRVFDVGGQRNERRKWMHCFDNVTGVIFVASLSGYDSKLLEDENTNRMKEALDLFAQINDETGKFGSEFQGSKPDVKRNKQKFKTMGEFFLEKPMILFLNKSDLYETKIAKTAQGKPGLEQCPYFREYRYPMFVNNKKKKAEQTMSRYDDGIEYVKHQFMLRNTHHTFSGHLKNVYVHVTNATDKEIIKKVFNDVQHILISQSLGEAGIM